MQRAVLCSYDWKQRTFRLKTVVRMTTLVRHNMTIVDKFCFLAFVLKKGNVGENVSTAVPVAISNTTAFWAPSVDPGTNPRRDRTRPQASVGGYTDRSGVTGVENVCDVESAWPKSGMKGAILIALMLRRIAFRLKSL
jgi:hypothetical protein